MCYYVLSSHGLVIREGKKQGSKQRTIDVSRAVGLRVRTYENVCLPFSDVEGRCKHSVPLARVGWKIRFPLRLLLNGRRKFHSPAVVFALLTSGGCVNDVRQYFIQLYIRVGVMLHHHTWPLELHTVVTDIQWRHSIDEKFWGNKTKKKRIDFYIKHKIILM